MAEAKLMDYYAVLNLPPRADLSGIAVGPTGTTGRKLYRTAAGDSQLKLVTTIADWTRALPA